MSSVRIASLLLLLAQTGCGHLGLDLIDAAESRADEASMDSGSGGPEGLPQDVSSFGGAPSEEPSSADTEELNEDPSRDPQSEGDCEPFCAVGDPLVLFEAGAEAGEHFSFVGSEGAYGKLTDAVSFMGEQSLMFQVANQQGWAGVDERLPVATEEELFLRAWVRLSEDQEITDLTLVEFNGDGAPGVAIHLDPSGAIAARVYPSDQRASSGRNVVPRGAWFCVQAAVYVSDTEGSVIVAVDEQVQLEMNDVDTLPAHGLTQFFFGITNTGPTQPPALLYFDDVAVGAEPIDCVQ